jgi:hypothetical protein
VLDVPLAIAGLTVGLVLACALGRGTPSGRWRAAPAALLAVVAAGITWAGFLAYEYDATWSRELRTTNLLHAVAVAEHVPEGALLFGSYPDWFATVKNLRPGVAVAFPRQDQYADFRGLALHWLAAGRPVFAVLAPQDWGYMRAQGHLDGIELRVAASGSPYPLMEARAVDVR